MSSIPSPYNFVPVSKHVFLPDGDAAVSRAYHDHPFRDGIDAVLRYRVTAETAVFVRGGATDAKGAARFFQTPDGRFALPGTTVRGALRNVVEIAGFGRLGRVNRHRYGVRDLNNRELYGQYMAEIRDVPDPRGGRKKEPVPLVSAGWLQRVEADPDEADPVVARIVCCDFAKIEYRRLIALAAARGARFSPGERRSAPRKYRDWPGDLDLEDFQVRELRFINQQSAAGVPFFSEMGAVTDRGKLVLRGRLVFTGQPSQWRENATPRPGGGHPKHHDFVFHPLPEEALGAQRKVFEVRRSEFETFAFVHSNRGEGHRLDDNPNEEWGYWKSRSYDAGGWVPVFVLPHQDGRLRAFGLAMMFRLAYDHGPKELIERWQKQGFDKAAKVPDLADLIFGRADDTRARDEAANNLKGRVSFGVAPLGSGGVEMDEVKAVLGAPKASFYPNYVEQSEDPEMEPGAAPRAAYRTYMDDAAVPRGWKRYRPHAEANLSPPVPPNVKSEKVYSRFRPLKAGAVFEGRVVVHNLRPWELGAIVWAARLGGAPEARHGIGMAKPFGFGRTRVELLSDTAQPLRTNEGAALTLDECERAFVERMEAWAKQERVIGGWRESLQVTELLANARPFAKGDPQARYPQLDDPARGKEFVRAKQERQVLAPAGDVAAWRARHRGSVVRGDASEGVVEFARVNQFVRVKLANGTKVDVPWSTDVIQGFAALNGRELAQGRKVTVHIEKDKPTRLIPR